MIFDGSNTGKENKQFKETATIEERIQNVCVSLYQLCIEGKRYDGSELIKNVFLFRALSLIQLRLEKIRQSFGPTLITLRYYWI